MKLSALAALTLALSTAAPALAEGWPVTCSHREGNFNAIIDRYPNSYPTPDYYLTSPAGTVAFDHVPGTETWRTEDGDLHSIRGVVDGNGRSGVQFRNFNTYDQLTCFSR